jgi:peroxiredoxin family protein
MILSRLTTFTWTTCFAHARLIYLSIVKLAIIYDNFVWYASHKRSNNVSATTTQFMKIQKVVLRIVFEDSRVTSLKILKEKTHVQFIHLHLSHLQVTIRDWLNKHEHRTLINDFCNRIKNRLVDAHERRQQHDILMSNERKQQWYEKFQKKLLSKNKIVTISCQFSSQMISIKEINKRG